MPDFNDFWEDLEKGILSLAESSFNEFKTGAIAAGNDFIEQSKADLQYWTSELAADNLSKEDFEWLVKSKENMAKLVILNHIGLTKVQVDKLTSGILKAVTEAALKIFTSN